MDNNQIIRLEKNLTRSAKKAKLYDVRGMVGYTESDQGFFSIFTIPLLNPIKKVNTPLSVLIEDIGTLYFDHEKLILEHESLKKELDDYKESQIQLQNKNIELMEELAQRISAIEAFRID